MRSPKDMATIQIDITNACIHNCSNCTRLCGHHKHPFFMNWETFKRAVDSLEGFEGRIGIMGGEPTIHPEFKRFVEYVAEKFNVSKEFNYFISPTSNFIVDRKLEERNYSLTYEYDGVVAQRTQGPGLFSSISSNYYKYYELIQDVFNYQCLNDHSHECFHQPVLVSRHDLKIEDDDWKKLRDNCWIQNKWSATITPKGCFFCEIAGALDMLFCGPGGWPIEKGWWKRTPEDFKDQLHWCEICGLALNTCSRDANEEIDDVSPLLLEKLKSVDSPKLRKGKIYLYDEQNETSDKKVRKSNYHDNNLNRFNCNQNSIYPKGFNLIYIANEEDNYEQICQFICLNSIQIIKLMTFVSVEQFDNVNNYVKKNNIQNVNVFKKNGNYGNCINIAQKETGELCWNIIASVNVRLSNEFTSKLIKYAFNPGTLHIIRSDSIDRNSLISFENSVGYFMLYNPNASALINIGYDGIAYCNGPDEFEKFWNEKKKVLFSDNVLLPRETINKMDYEPGKRYVIYGTGQYGHNAFESIKAIGSEVVFYVDSNKSLHGKMMNGKVIYGPEKLKNKEKVYDEVVIATVAYKDVRDTLLNLGLTDDEIVAPIF